MDAQPTPNGILVFVDGHVLTEGEDSAPLRFAQIFHLVENGQGSYFVFNDIFNLI